MKVGTDGVLLGAWAKADNPKTILDIGSGTGLISLMLAQRYQNAQILGLEIDKNAFQESLQNFANSKFSQRCQVIHSSLQNFKTDQKFDLIVSNPPFFDFIQSKDDSRNIARQNSQLNFEELIDYSEKLLSENGNAAFVIPFSEELNFMTIAEKFALYISKITRVKGKSNKEFKRSLLLFSRKNSTLISDELILEIDRHVYTSDYIELTKYFYLNM